MSCSNGTSASQHFLSFLLRWRQPPPRSHTSKAERRPRARRPPRLMRRPRRTPRLHRTWRPHRTRHLPRRTSPRHGLRRILPRRMCRRSAQRRNRLAPRSGGLPGRPVHPLRRWRDTRRRHEALRLRRSNGRKPQAAMSAAVERNSPSRLSPARATMWGAHPRRRAPRRRWALPRRAPRQRHSPLTADANAAQHQNATQPNQLSRTAPSAAPRPATPEPSRAACCATRPLPISPPPTIPARARWRARRFKAGSSTRNGDGIVLSRS